MRQETKFDKTKTNNKANLKQIYKYINIQIKFPRQQQKPFGAPSVSV